jgi:hypothetical protein
MCSILLKNSSHPESKDLDFRFRTTLFAFPLPDTGHCSKNGAAGALKTVQLDFRLWQIDDGRASTAGVAVVGQVSISVGIHFDQTDQLVSRFYGSADQAFGYHHENIFERGFFVVEAVHRHSRIDQAFHDIC